MGKDRAKIYFDFLKEYPIGKLKDTFRWAIQELKFFPKISELIDHLTEDPHSSIDYWPEFKEIEHKENVIPKAEAKTLVSAIYDELDKKREIKNAERQKHFSERKKILEEQKKQITGEAS
jgi:hypothetical protein